MNIKGGIKMTKTGKKTGRAIFAAALAACVALSAFAGYPAQKAGAATKRTAVAETLLLSSEIGRASCRERVLRLV